MSLGSMRPSGKVTMKKLTTPKAPILWRAKNLINLVRAFPALVLARIGGATTGMVWAESTLSLKKLSPAGVVDYGVVSHRVVTDTFVAALVTSLRTNASPGTFKYHGLGANTQVESATDTALLGEFQSEYAVANVRVTGTQANTGTNIYVTVGTHTFSANVAVTEHGVFDNATQGSGVLMDRSKFAVINLQTGESLQSTYSLTIQSGG